MILHKIFHGICAVVFVALFVIGSVNLGNDTFTTYMPQVFLMAFGMFGLLIQFVLIHFMFMDKYKKTR